MSDEKTVLDKHQPLLMLVIGTTDYGIATDIHITLVTHVSGLNGPACTPCKSHTGLSAPIASETFHAWWMPQEENVMLELGMDCRMYKSRWLAGHRSWTQLAMSRWPFVGEPHSRLRHPTIQQPNLRRNTDGITTELRVMPWY